MADPNRRPPIDDQVRARIRQRALEGLSGRQIAESVGRPLPTVYQVIREMGGIRRIRAEGERKGKSAMDATNKRTAQAKTFERHPLSEIWGDMPEDEFSNLAKDIGERGLIDPIVMHEGKILDGWHRYRACLQCGINPERRDYAQHIYGDPAGYVIARNMMRRHLTAGQRAMVAAKIADMRQGQRTDLASIEARSQSDAAGALNVSRSSVQRATAVREHAAPEVVEAVERGEMSLNAAAQQTRAQPKPGPEPGPKPSKIEQLEDALHAARIETGRKQDRIDELEERISFMEDQDRPHDAARMATLNNQRALITTLKSNVAQWQQKYREAEAENGRLRKRLRALGEDIAA